jgi:solute carrier family 40 (iron-regulated transporter), member 1
MLSMATTAIFSKPEDFRFPVLISYSVLIASTLLFARFAAKNRGMAFHIPQVGGSVNLGP